MSRSRKRTPIIGVTAAASEAAYKAFEHRRARRLNRMAVAADDEPSHPREFGNPWSGPKDGKRWDPNASRRK